MLFVLPEGFAAIVLEWVVAVVDLSRKENVPLIVNDADAAAEYSGHVLFAVDGVAAAGVLGERR